MENKIQIFDNEEFGVVRVVMIDGVPWFVAADVCRVLEITNSRDALSRLDDDEKDDVGITDAIGRQQQTNVVNEPGLYHLIFTSRKPEAHKFRRWVFHEVLPAIRQTGGYSVDDDNNRFATATAFERGVELRRTASHMSDPILKQALLVEAANLIAGREFVSENPFYEPDLIYKSKVRSDR